MIVRFKNQSQKTRSRIIDLTGPAGKHWAILALAQDLCEQLKWNESKTRAIMDDIKSAKDYIGLIENFDKYFGDFVDLYTKETRAGVRAGKIDKILNDKL
jgi:hypothetical protein